MPFLWSDNLVVTDEMLRDSPDDPEGHHNWSWNVEGGGPVVIVRKGGAMQVVKKEQMSDLVFFAGRPPLHPENLEVLSPGR